MNEDDKYKHVMAGIFEVPPPEILHTNQGCGRIGKQQDSLLRHAKKKHRSGAEEAGKHKNLFF
jgi:hypothetical protein